MNEFLIGVGVGVGNVLVNNSLFDCGSRGTSNNPALLAKCASGQAERTADLLLYGIPFAASLLDIKIGLGALLGTFAMSLIGLGGFR